MYRKRKLKEVERGKVYTLGNFVWCCAVHPVYRFTRGSMSIISCCSSNTSWYILRMHSPVDDQNYCTSMYIMSTNVYMGADITEVNNQLSVIVAV